MKTVYAAMPPSPVTYHELMVYVYRYLLEAGRLAELTGYNDIALAIDSAERLIDLYTARLDVASPALRAEFAVVLGGAHDQLRRAIMAARTKGAGAAVKLMEQGYQIDRGVLITLGLDGCIHRPGERFNLFEPMWR